VRLALTVFMQNDGEFVDAILLYLPKKFVEPVFTVFLGCIWSVDTLNLTTRDNIIKFTQTLTYGIIKDYTFQ
jgi:hypothetical protein